MTDLIKRNDALPIVTVKPLDKFGVRELARVSGISPTTAMRVKRGEGDLDGSTLRAVLAATGTCLCCCREPQPIDPVAIREAALRDAAEKATARWAARRKHADQLAEMDYPEAAIDAKTVSAKADEAEMIAEEILALIGEKK